jgi:predicted kinase
VVVDNTNATIASRATLIALGQAHGATIIGYSFRATLAEALGRNRLRAGKARVPDVAIYAIAKHLSPPTYAEGFDLLYEVTLVDGDGFTVVEVAR